MAANKVQQWQNLFLTSMAAKINIKNEQHPRKNSNYILNEPNLITILFNKGLGPFDYRTIENPKYQKKIDNQNKFESQRKVLKRTENEKISQVFISFKNVKPSYNKNSELYRLHKGGSVCFVWTEIKAENSLNFYADFRPQV